MLALACDHGGYELMQEIKAYLDGMNIEYKDFGTYTPENCDYPGIASRAARAITAGECEKGIFACGTGVGMSITANKIPGIRAALCSDCFTAEMTRRHNDANVLALGGRVLGAGLALKIVDVYLNTSFEGGGRHSRRIAMLDEIERR